MSTFVAMMSYEQFWQSLTARYETGEARAVARMVLEVGFGMSMAQLLCDGLSNLSEAELLRLSEMQQRLLKGEPVQYVLGVADFGPHQLQVATGVLIPRPETYELCEEIVKDFSKSSHSPLRILDLGTGSGCIACTLAAELPAAEMTACDISAEALAIAKENARKLDVSVRFVQGDMLALDHSEELAPERIKISWDVIVSNPPYICMEEAALMEPHVLEHEPHQALFVPDDDPLLFYRAIADYATKTLRHGGTLYLELNAHYAEDCRQLFIQNGFADVRLMEDQFGKLRFLKATQP
jgi:release factor glutamine methyltransferase